MTDPIFDARIAAIDATADTGMHAPQVVAATVAFLRELAGEGSALEFGIGTGRIAVPLQESGVAVTGIDLSQHMVAKLHERPGGKDIHVTIGDIATADVGGTFSLVYAIWNTDITVELSLVRGSRFQSAQRPFSVSPAICAIRSSSEGHTYRHGDDHCSKRPSSSVQ